MDFNHIIFIRHAENVNNLSVPNNELELTNLGIKQAINARKYLNGKFDILVSSPSKRAIMTAKLIAPNFNIICDERLLERGWGNKEHNGLESDSEAKTRITIFLREYMSKYPNKSILFVTHGSLIKLSQDVIEEKILARSNIDNCDIIEYSKNKCKKIIKKSSKNLVK